MCRRRQASSLGSKLQAPPEPPFLPSATAASSRDGVQGAAGTPRPPTGPGNSAAHAPGDVSNAKQTSPASSGRRLDEAGSRPSCRGSRGALVQTGILGPELKRKTGLLPFVQGKQILIHVLFWGPDSPVRPDSLCLLCCLLHCPHAAKQVVNPPHRTGRPSGACCVRPPCRGQWDAHHTLLSEPLDFSQAHAHRRPHMPPRLIMNSQRCGSKEIAQWFLTLLKILEGGGSAPGKPEPWGLGLVSSVWSL